MITKTHRQFWRCFDQLSSRILALARERFRRWRATPAHLSLRFEERRNGARVVTVGDHSQAIGLREGDVIAWFWIGTHEAYDRFRF